MNSVAPWTWTVVESLPMSFLLVAQIIVSTLLIGAILIQSRGAGLGSAFGGQAKSYHSRRGFEKMLFKATVVLAVVFLFLSLVALI